MNTEDEKSLALNNGMAGNEEGLGAVEEKLAKKEEEIKALRLEIDQLRTRYEGKIDLLSTLMDVGNLINSTLDSNRLLKRVTTAAAKMMNASDGSLMLVDGRARELVFKIAIGEKGTQLRQHRIKLGQGIAGKCALTGEPIIVSDTSKDDRFDPSVDLETGFETKSIICMPITVREKVVGVIEVLNAACSWPLPDEHVDIFQAFANMVGVALENARAHQYSLERQRMNNELSLARSIQQNLLPKVSGYANYAEIASESIPARMVGGNFFDFVELGPKRFGLMIGDVSGKGIPGALLMVRTVSDFRLRARPDKRPDEVIRRLNNDLLKGITRGMYVTAIYAIFDFGRGVLQFANAGHPPLFLRPAASKEPLCLDEWAGVPLGIQRNYKYETKELPIVPGDLVFFYTDGISEARNKNKEEFSRTRLRRLMKTSQPLPQALIDNILAEKNSFSAGKPSHDDITLLAIGVKQVD